MGFEAVHPFAMPLHQGGIVEDGDLLGVVRASKVGMVIRLSDEKKPPAPRREGDRQTGLVLDERTRTKKPPMYKVLLHNDDYTTREFVVWVLQTVFHKNESDAVAIMSHVHNNGVGIAGVYTFEVAETKVTKTLHLAKAQQFPLQLSIEPTD
jgi:ATP-dependent Clp protease adaptor protein ClpS